MKRVLNVAVMLMAVVVAATSCLNKSGDFVPYNTAVVSIVDGDAMTGLYAIFDDNKKAYIENESDLTVSTSSYYKGEARALIAYTDVAMNPIMGYDHVINVSQLVELKTKPVQIGLTDDIASKYTAGVNIPYYNGGVTYARDRYVNVQFVYQCGGSSMADKHDFVLVYNPTRMGNFALGYPKTDDGYLYLELYHNQGTDTAINSTSENIISFYLTNDMLGEGTNITSDYFGVKILYRNYESSDLSVATYKFVK